MNLTPPIDSISYHGPITFRSQDGTIYSTSLDDAPFLRNSGYVQATLSYGCTDLSTYTKTIQPFKTWLELSKDPYLAWSTPYNQASMDRITHDFQFPLPLGANLPNNLLPLLKRGTAIVEDRYEALSVLGDYKKAAIYRVDHELECNWTVAALQAHVMLPPMLGYKEFARLPDDPEQLLVIDDLPNPFDYRINTLVRLANLLRVLERHKKTHILWVYPRDEEDYSRQIPPYLVDVLLDRARYNTSQSECILGVTWLEIAHMDASSDKYGVVLNRVRDYFTGNDHETFEAVSTVDNL